MKRREFLKKSGAAAAAVAASSVAAPAVLAAEKTYRWKMVTTWPPKHPGAADRRRDVRQDG
ncbi:MAG: twin-arginine translocation signal domain-containing protein [Desulfobacterales bacterium]|nr:twin-arginine translocation signal domain-containing protein [Desulfobacterales bacterium]